MRSDYQSQINELFDSGLCEEVLLYLQKAYELQTFTCANYSKWISNRNSSELSAEELAQAVLFALCVRGYIFVIHKGKIITDTQEAINLIGTSCEELTFKVTFQLEKIIEDKKRERTDRFLGLIIPIAISFLALIVSIVALVYTIFGPPIEVNVTAGSTTQESQEIQNP